MKQNILIYSFIFFLLSCQNDSREELLNQASTECITTGVSYQIDITPIISTNCFICHKGNQASGGINLEGYENIKLQAKNGKLYGTIAHLNGFKPMPKNGNKLSDCEINKIKIWIDSGTPNN